MVITSGDHSTDYEGHISGATNERIKCYLYLGNFVDKKPPIVKIPISSNTINSGIKLTFYIANIKNPSTQN